MRIGIISDTHGCLIALKTALDWLENAQINIIVCAGDVASFGPQPNECIALLAARNIPTVQGNCDLDLLKPAVEQPATARMNEIADINNWGRAQLTPESRAWLAALPHRYKPAPDVIVVHGGLDKADEIVTADTRPSLPPGITVVAAGHLHTPFQIVVPQGIWVNAGSVGRPCDGDPRGAVAVLEQQPSGWKVSLHRVVFDVPAAVRAIREAKMPYTERLIETQLEACWW